MEQFVKSFSFEHLRAAKDLKKRLLFTLGALIIFRIGAYIPIPGINVGMIKQMIQQSAGGILGMLDMFSGGSLTRMTIFTLSITPYISASIIIQLISTIYGPWKEFRKEGELGKRKINKYTRYLTVIIAALQALGFSFWIVSMGDQTGISAVIVNTTLFHISTVLTITGATLFLMWLGEQITSRGVGQGISLILYTGIVVSLVPNVIKTIAQGRDEGTYLVIFGLAMVAAVFFAYVTYVEKAIRKIPIQHPRRGTSLDQNVLPTYMPIKVNYPGVMPHIFANSIIALPMMAIGYFFARQDTAAAFLNTVRYGSFYWQAAMVVLIAFFSFFYTHLQFNAEETADNLKKSQAYIPGVRPGKPTQEYLEHVLNRLTVWSALYLITIYLIPEFIRNRLGLPFYFQGTTILILVSVAIETITSIQGYLFAHQYQGLIKGGKRKITMR